MTKRGLYTGRFQPFHKGHLYVVRQALKEVDFLYIGIGSAQSSHSDHNPFTAEEREKMIVMALQKNGISKKQFKIIPIPDIHDNDAWPDYVRAIVPEFDMLFTGEYGIVRELFKKHTKIPVKVMKRKRGVSATKVRDALRQDKKWKRFVCAEVADYIKKINGAERIRYPSRGVSTRAGKLPVV